MWISELRDRVREALLEFCWGQWAQMGLAARISRQDRWAMDPEALLLLTLEVARRDPRLFDEILDWMALNGHLLSPHRLRNLSREHPGDRQLVRAAMAWAAAADPALRWRVPPPDPMPASVDVFPPDVVGLVREEDPVFAGYGYRRPNAERSGKSTEPDPREPINLAFQLRHLFGTGTRPEIVRVLLTSDERQLDAAQVAKRAGFEKRNVNEALASLVQSRVVKMRPAGNRRIYLVHLGKWADLLEIGPRKEHLPTARRWVHLFRALTALHLWLEREADPEWSDYLAASEARQLIGSHSADLLEAGVDPVSPRSAQGTEFVRTFERIAEQLLAQLEPEGR